MKNFTDNAGRDWIVEINVSALKRIKGLTGTDLLEAIDGPLVERLIRDPVLLCDVVYAACKPQADERQVSDEDFGRAMAGDAIDRGPPAAVGPRRHVRLARLQAQRHIADVGQLVPRARAALAAGLEVEHGLHAQTDRHRLPPHPVGDTQDRRQRRTLIKVLGGEHRVVGDR